VRWGRPTPGLGLRGLHADRHLALLAAKAERHLSPCCPLGVPVSAQVSIDSSHCSVRQRGDDLAVDPKHAGAAWSTSLRLVEHPILLGGRGLFKDVTERHALTFVGAKPLAVGLVHLTYSTYARSRDCWLTILSLGRCLNVERRE
jgi:hypothetical protein